MRLLLSVSLLFWSAVTLAQPYAVGTRSLTFVDPDRGRDIPTDVYYPADDAGAEVAVASGTFPVLVIGHGFVMGADVYGNLWEHFVPLGYIVALPTTEGGLAPDHAEFGADLAFLATALQAAHADAASPFFGHVAPATALMGHSMGGGASFLGAAGNSSIQALVNFAPAETDPSAIAAAANVLVPTLVFGGSEDCVTPIATNQQPMYDALTVPCKALVNVLGGGHCYFAENTFTCSFGELTCGPDLTISREEQHDVVNDLAGLWLDHFLRSGAGALAAFQDSLTTSTRITASSACLITAVEANAIAPFSISPTMASERITLQGPSGALHMVMLDALGRVVARNTVQGPKAELDVSGLPEGMYRLSVVDGAAMCTVPFVVVR